MGITGVAGYTTGRMPLRIIVLGEGRSRTVVVNGGGGVATRGLFADK
jgi:hypothetical protein